MKLLYQITQPLLFLFSAERAHHLAMGAFGLLLKIPLVSNLIRKGLKFEHPSLEREVFGLKFKNPVGLAAGFDKDGKYLDVLGAMGFGFVELGTVTPRPQGGNPKPRLFRLKKDQALINRMGFNNEGVRALVERLKKFKNPDGYIIGGNIGKNKDTPNEKAVEDYTQCFDLLHPYVDYFVVNVSSPNTPGLRALQNKDSLTQILSSLQDINKEKESEKPILLKISPDLEREALVEVIEVVNQLKIAGLVSSNTSIRRENLNTDQKTLENIGAGGLSGLPIYEYSSEVLRTVSQLIDPNIGLIGVGGIDHPNKAEEKLKMGADLIQVYSGMIYYGPSLIKDILKKLTLR